jgi:hypothetical protein
MPRGHPYSHNVDAVLLYMRDNLGLDASKTARLTGVGQRTVQRRFRDSEHPVQVQPVRKRGVSKKLDKDDTAVRSTPRIAPTSVLIPAISRSVHQRLDRSQSTTHARRNQGYVGHASWKARSHLDHLANVGLGRIFFEEGDFFLSVVSH